MLKWLPPSIRSYLPVIYLVLALLALRSTVVEPYVVPTGSMEPTLKPGDRLYALKCAYHFRIPFTDVTFADVRPVRRGDVILFRAPKDPSITYVKRAVALAGDRLEIRKGNLFVNGEEIVKREWERTDVMYDIEGKEHKSLFVENLSGVKHYVILDRAYDDNPFLAELHHRNLAEITIPAGHLFAVGDNRDNSHDSRAWGFVPMENLKGRAMFIWLSCPADDQEQGLAGWASSLIRCLTLQSLRSERVGTLIQ